MNPVKWSLVLKRGNAPKGTRANVHVPAMSSKQEGIMNTTYSIEIRRHFNIYKTSIHQWRPIEVETTSCLYWVAHLLSISELVSIHWVWLIGFSLGLSESFVAPFVKIYLYRFIKLLLPLPVSVKAIIIMKFFIERSRGHHWEWLVNQK